MGIIGTRWADPATEGTARGEPDAAVLAPPVLGWVEELSTTKQSCCCAAKPVVAVVVAASGGPDEPTAVLLCGHHYRASHQVLASLGACVYDRSGQLVTGNLWSAA